MTTKLTPRQERFCQEYLIDLNGTQAAIRTGYSAKTANEQAAQLLAKLSIQSRITELQQLRTERTQITADMVLEELWSIAKDDVRNYLSFKPVTIRTKDPLLGIIQTEHKIDIVIKDSSKIHTKNISEISIGKDGQFKFKLYGRDTALLQVGRHLGMFKDKLELEEDLKVDVTDFNQLLEIARKNASVPDQSK